MSYTLHDFYFEAGIEPSPPWARDIVLTHPGKGEPMRPRWHQITGLKLVFGFENNRAALYDDMGTGKSVIAQAYAIWHAWAGNRVVGLMPPVLCEQFMWSLVKTFPGIHKHLRLGLFRGEQKKRDLKVAKWYPDNIPDFVLTSYHLFRDHFMLFDQMLQGKVLLMDECRPLSGTESKIRDAIDFFMGPEGEKAALIMNGTPGRKDITDLYGLIKFVTPRVYPTRMAFDRQHVKYVKVNTKSQDRFGSLVDRKVEIIDSVHGLADLYENLYLQARRVEKKDVLELPGISEIPREFSLASEHRSLYKKLVEERLLFFPDGSMIDITLSASVRATCMRAVSNPQKYLGLQGDENSWLEALDELVEEIDLSKHKVVVFGYYRETIEMLEKYFKRFKPVVINGTVTPAKAEKNKRTFIDDDKCRMLIANYESGGVGLDGLQDVCWHAIGAEPTPIPGDYKQARDRLYRSGQTEKVLFYMLEALGTIFVKTINTMWSRDDTILQATSVMSKSDFERELLGDEEQEVELDLENW